MEESHDCEDGKKSFIPSRRCYRGQIVNYRDVYRANNVERDCEVDTFTGKKDSHGKWKLSFLRGPYLFTF